MSTTREAERDTAEQERGAVDYGAAISGIGPSIAGILYDVNTKIPYVFGAAILLLSTMILANWKRTGKGEVPSSTASM
ncbi:hypothetical protein QJQ58_10485 [Paenibacillus dendritiformis]|uniref:hypothetical protein n=1 Tax=Paenibacillus dendritiformis TaxID=130049 RepID=UPI00248B346F|nr:hypothetical protein [Paenibacillus dendritiformis]WGU96629.1 hypothetical protein QJQ58_10485 [Paenibacillus dendritiformis]